MKHATQLIKNEMENTGIKFAVNELADRSVIQAGFGIKNGPSVTALFISTNDDNDVGIRIFGVVQGVEEAKRNSMLKAINECNSTYRFLKFAMDDDGDVSVQYDMPVRTTDAAVGPMACEIFIRMMNIMDDAYSILMKAMWC